MGIKQVKTFPVFITHQEAIAVNHVILEWLASSGGLPQPTEERQFLAEMLSSFQTRLVEYLPHQARG
jgi:hypothetical protein